MVVCMAVMAREAWTDERLDDFKENVNRRFDDVDKRLDKLEAGVRTGFAETNARFDSMQRTMLVGIFTVLASIWASVIGAVLAVVL
jgi:hypothetical protein